MSDNDWRPFRDVDEVVTPLHDAEPYRGDEKRECCDTTVNSYHADDCPSLEHRAQTAFHAWLKHNEISHSENWGGCANVQHLIEEFKKVGLKVVER